MHFFAFSSILVAISNFSMASLVYFKGRTKKPNIAWAIFLLAASLWGIGSYKATTTLNETDVILWMRITYIGIILIPTFFYQFVYMFLGIQRKKIIVTLYVISIFFILINFISKSLFLGELGIIFSSFYWVISPGPLWFLFLFYYCGLIAYSEYRLFKGYRVSTGPKRNQIRYVFLATLLGFVSGATCYLPCFGIKFYPGLGNIGVSLYCIPLAYAIVKYRVMDIKVAITRTGIFVAVYTLVLGVPFAIVVWFKDKIIETFGTSWWILPLGLMAGLATFGPFIYIYLNRKAEQGLLREQHRYQEILKQFAREMTRIHNFKKLLNLIVYTVTKSVRISHSAIYLLDTESEGFILQAARNLKKGQTNLINKTSSLTSYLNDHAESLVYEETRQKVQEGVTPIFKELEKEMLSLNATVVVPSFLDDKLLALLILGDKRSGKIYTSEDLRIFSVLASQASLAIESALLYKNIEEKVAQRTKELVDVQKQLIHAEKLATVGTLAGGVAHEINNPLTAILTNAQMLLASTNDTPDIESARESIKLIEEATKRCRTIVKKLMTYAKKPLETTEISKVDLLNVLKNVISFVGYQLEQENIKIITEAKEDTYLVMGNANELEQVVTNIIINAKDAIKQAKKAGAIHISFSKTEDWIKIAIKDEGSGIPKEVIPKLFDPFFTTKEVGRGLGLGLSICQSIIEKNNGLISVQSEPNSGSTFTIQLPRLKQNSTVGSEVYL